MKRSITGAAAVAILTVAWVSTSEAWFFKAKNEMNKVTAGQNANTGKNSFNRTNAHNTSRSKNVFNGTNNSSVGIGGGDYRDQGNGTAKNARAGISDWRNDGIIGHGNGTITAGNVSVGDTVSTGSNYGSFNTGTDAMARQNEALKIQADKDVDIEKIRSNYGTTRSGSVR